MNGLGEEPLGAEWCQELAAGTGELQHRVGTLRALVREPWAVSRENVPCCSLILAVFRELGLYPVSLKMGRVVSGDIWLCHQFYLKTIISRILCSFLAQE